MHKMREISAIVTEKIVIKVSLKKLHVSRPCSFGGEVVHVDADANAAE